MLSIPCEVFTRATFKICNHPSDREPLGAWIGFGRISSLSDVFAGGLLGYHGIGFRRLGKCPCNEARSIALEERIRYHLPSHRLFDKWTLSDRLVAGNSHHVCSLNAVMSEIEQHEHLAGVDLGRSLRRRVNPVFSPSDV